MDDDEFVALCAGIAVCVTIFAVYMAALVGAGIIR